MLNIFKRLGAALVVAALLFLALRPDQAQALPAFPGAEGWGANSAGGRGGAVIQVTHLRDDLTTGSLRKCVTTPGPRTCVFRIGGTITLSSRLTIDHPYLTIAGQTAPGGGILIKGHAILMNTHNVVIRYIRHRRAPGSDGKGIQVNGGTRAHDIIVDHSSFGWQSDDNDVWGANGLAENVTFQWSIFSEASRGFLAGAPPGSGARLGKLSLHHNYWVSNAFRNPFIAGDGQTELVNNVMYNWQSFGTFIQNRSPNGVKINVIGNFWKRGPDSGGNRYELLVLTPNSIHPVAQPPGLIYVNDNIGPHRTQTNQPQFAFVGLYGSGTQAAPVNLQRSTPWALSANPITVSSATANVNHVLDNVGATLPSRDSVDTRLVSEYRNGTGQVDGPQIGNYPVILNDTVPIDADVDGMPDSWENANGLNPNLASDRNSIDGSGYTELEVYLNSGDLGADPPDPLPEKFDAADRIYVNASTVSVRSSAGGTITGSQVRNAQGAISSGPTIAAGTKYWNVNFDTGTDGWVPEGQIELVVDGDFPPVVSITAPVVDATVQGASVAVTASASDNVGVSGVQFKLDGANLGSEDTSAAYSTTWDTTAVANGPHTLAAVARDAAGNTTTSSSVAVTVNNVPTNGFNVGQTTVLASNDTPSGSLILTRAITLSQRAQIESITMWANTAAGNIKMALYDDDGTAGIPGTLLASTPGVAPSVVGWLTQSVTTPVILAPGTYWLAFNTDGGIQLKGQSTGGNNRKDAFTYASGFSNPFVEGGNDTWQFSQYATFTPQQDTTAPATAVTAPSAGPVSGNSVSVTASASDAVGVVGVSFHAASGSDGPTAANIIGVEDTTSTYGVTWDTTTWVNGAYNLYSVARDAAGNKTTSAAIAVTVANVLDAPSDLEVIRDVE